MALRGTEDTAAPPSHPFRSSATAPGSDAPHRRVYVLESWEMRDSCAAAVLAQHPGQMGQANYNGEESMGCAFPIQTVTQEIAPHADIPAHKERMVNFGRMSQNADVFFVTPCAVLPVHRGFAARKVMPDPSKVFFSTVIGHILTSPWSHKCARGGGCGTTRASSEWEMLT